MQFRLSKKTRAKLPIGDDQVPLKTAENLEEYLQSAISFLQTQEAVLERILSILEQIAKLEPLMKADVIRNITKEQEEQSRKTFKKLKMELKGLTRLKFNDQSLFSQNEADSSFKLFKKAGSNAPQIKQPPAKRTSILFALQPKVSMSMHYGVRFRHYKKCSGSPMLLKVTCRQVLWH